MTAYYYRDSIGAIAHCITTSEIDVTNQPTIMIVNKSIYHIIIIFIIIFINLYKRLSIGR